MRKYLSLALLSSILFLFASCGMPNYHGYQDEIDVDSIDSIGGERYKAGFNVTLTNIDGILDTLDDNTPSILLMYSLYPQDYIAANSFIRQFKNIYKGGSATHDNGTPASFSSGSLNNVEYTYEGIDLHLYGMTGDGGTSLYSAPKYSYGPIEWKVRTNSGSYKYYFEWYFMIDVSSTNSSDNSFNLVMDVWRGDTYGNVEKIADDIVLNSFSGDPFYTQYSTSLAGRSDYEYYRGNEDTTNVDVNLFCACSVLPGAESEYNNLYWSELTSDSFSI